MRNGNQATRIPTTMELRFFITVYLLLFNYLPPKDATVVAGTVIVIPDEKSFNRIDQCTITEQKCKEYLEDIQLYTVHSLNIERYKVSKGMIDKMPIATDMLHLENDPHLGRKAQEYAEDCVKVPGLRKCSVAGRNDYGEAIVFIRKYNIENVRPRRSMAAMFRVNSVIVSEMAKASMFEEQDLRDMVVSYNAARREETLKYIATVVHASVWKVGCGFADYFITPSEFKEVFACFFGPPKLQNGEVLYIPGCVPCTHCPKETTCITDKPKFFADTLCKVNDPFVGFLNNYDLPRGKICTKVEVTVPSDVVQVPLDATENGLEQCRGDTLCSTGWRHNGRYSSILVRQKCTSAAIFRNKIHIQSNSCFQFYYTKRTNTSHLNSEVIAFAFQANDSDKRIKAVKTEANGHFIYLDISWTGVDIYVGFGTRSLSHTNDYEIIVKNHLVTSGKCLG